MKFLANIALILVFLIPSYIFAQANTENDDTEKPRFKTQVIVRGTAPDRNLSSDKGNLITTSSSPVPGPVMRSASLPKSTPAEQLGAYQLYLSSLSEEYKQDHPDVIKALELMISNKKKEISVLQGDSEPSPSN